MAKSARRCSLCSINFPATTEFRKCLVCAEPTSFFSNIAVDDDWEEQVARSTEDTKIAVSPEAKLQHYRLGRFTDAGLGFDKAIIFAADSKVDLHRFEALVKNGCPIDTATRIVAPL